MGIVEGVVVVLLVVALGSVIYFLSRSRARVMGYHDIPTPRVHARRRRSSLTRILRSEPQRRAPAPVVVRALEAHRAP